MRRTRRYNPHRTTKTEIVGWVLVCTLGFAILATFVTGGVYVAACSYHGQNMCQ